MLFNVVILLFTVEQGEFCIKKKKVEQGEGVIESTVDGCMV